MLADRSFKELLGTSKQVSAYLYQRLFNDDPKSDPLDLLMGLHFLKAYSTEAVNAALFNVTPKTFRKRAWRCIHQLASWDDIVVWDNRHTERNEGFTVKVSVDGTDCPIQEPSPFNPAWYSHKFKGPGLRYEICLEVINGDIVWANGPYSCGSWPDLRIARHALIHALEEGEKVFADSGYRGDCHFLTPTGINDEYSRLTGHIRARQETVNARLKAFNCLSNVFCHDLNLHAVCFYSVINILQLEIEDGNPLFSVV